MTDQMMITANMAGCWLDGNQGWHNNHRIVALAMGWGWKGPENWEGWQDEVERYAVSGGNDEDESVIGQGGLADQAFKFLDGITESCHFERDMGELSLLRCQDLEDGACDCEVKS
jgi:hypothetical protein